jgi:hypothetical protein
MFGAGALCRRLLDRRYRLGSCDDASESCGGNYHVVHSLLPPTRVVSCGGNYHVVCVVCKHALRGHMSCV